MTSYSLSAPLSASKTYEHPWYTALQRLGNTTSFASGLMPKQPPEKTGVKHIDLQQKQERN